MAFVFAIFTCCGMASAARWRDLVLLRQILIWRFLLLVRPGERWIVGYSSKICGFQCRVSREAKLA